MKFARKLLDRFWPHKKAEVIPINLAPKDTITRFGGIGNQLDSVKSSPGYMPGIES